MRSSMPLVLVRSALLTGLCRFVPVPFLDDYLESKVRHFMVHSLLGLAARTYRSGHLAPIWEGAQGCLGGCLGKILGLPFAFLVKLLKKLWKGVLVFLAVHEATLHVGETLLLGYVLHRHLGEGTFPNGAEELPDLGLRKDAARFRTAFDRTFAGSDRRLLAKLLSGVFEQVRGLPRAGAHAVRAMFRRKKDPEKPEPGPVPEADREVLEQGVAELAAAVEQDRMKSFLRDFDERFDAAFRELRDADVSS